MLEDEKSQVRICVKIALGITCRRLLKPLVYPSAQVDGVVKDAEGETSVGALTGTSKCATSRRTELAISVVIKLTPSQPISPDIAFF